MEILRFFLLGYYPWLLYTYKNSFIGIIPFVYPNFLTKTFVADAPIIWKKKLTVTILRGIKVLSRNQKSPIAARLFQNQVWLTERYKIERLSSGPYLIQFACS